MSSSVRATSIGARLRRARQARGLSLQEVADLLARPLTRAALSKYERGETIPRADVLVDVGRVLGLSGSYFLDPAEPGEDAVRWIAYRKHSTLGKREAERIQAKAEICSGAYRRLLDLLHPATVPDFPAASSASTDLDAEEAAESLRERWGLGSSPVESLVGCVEDAGALVVGWKDHAKFDALSGWTDMRLPVIVLNLDRPDDRRRFNLAHELGHLALETGTIEAREEESLAHRFAAAFLVPREAAYRELGRRRQHVTLTELEHLKEKYGVSMQAWTRRARDLGIVTEEIYRSWQIWFRTQGHHVKETTEFRGQETPERLRILAVQALAERLVDRSWVRSFCPEAVHQVEDDVQESALGRLLRRPTEERVKAVTQAAAAAAEDYRNDPEVAAFLAPAADEWREEDDDTECSAPPKEG